MLEDSLIRLSMLDSVFVASLPVIVSGSQVGQVALDVAIGAAAIHPMSAYYLDPLLNTPFSCTHEPLAVASPMLLYDMLRVKEAEAERETIGWRNLEGIT